MQLNFRLTTNQFGVFDGMQIDIYGSEKNAISLARILSAFDASYPICVFESGKDTPLAIFQEQEEITGIEK